MLRRVWMPGAAALGALRRRLGRHDAQPLEPAHHARLPRGLPRGARRGACTAPRSKPQLQRCPLLSLPNNKLIPDARWILDSTGQRDIVARSAGARGRRQRAASRSRTASLRGSVAVYPLGSAVFFEAIVDVGDDPRDQVPLAGFRRVFTSRYYAVYANC